MANVKLSRYECSRDLLPDVCMFCGEPATVRKQKTFAWHPSWVWVLILVNLIVVLIVAMVLTKKMPTRVPVCDRHAGWWTRRTLILLFSFLFMAAACLAGIFYVDSQPGNAKGDLSGVVCGGGVGLFLVWLIVAAIYGTRGVRPTEITDRDMKLTGVHEAFIDALQEDRARERDQRDAGRFGDERDDYDDDRDREPPRRSYDDDGYRPRRRRMDRDEPDDRPRGRRDDYDDRRRDDDRDDRPRRRRDEYDD